LNFLVNLSSGLQLIISPSTTIFSFMNLNLQIFFWTFFTPFGVSISNIFFVSSTILPLIPIKFLFLLSTISTCLPINSPLKNSRTFSFILSANRITAVFTDFASFRADQFFPAIRTPIFIFYNLITAWLFFQLYFRLVNTLY